MTPKKLTAMLSLVLLTGGIALTHETATAQEPAPPPSTPRVIQGAPDISLFVSGGTFLGVYAEDVNKENMSTYGQSQVRGVGITEVVKSSPAERAGLKKGDVILRFDNEVVSSVRKLNRLVGESSPDQTTRLSISRGGSEQEVTVTLAKRTENADAWQLITPRGELGRVNPQALPRIEGFPGLGQSGENFIFNFGNNRRIGVSTQQLTKQLADYFGVKDGGVLITSVNEDSPAAKAGLKAGDIITAIDGEKVEGSGDLSRAINKQKEGDVTLTVVRDKNQRTVRVTPTKAEAPMALPGGRTLNRQVFRDSIRNSIVRGARNGNIVIPAINLPTIPAINIMTPQINLPTIPEINVVVPRVRVGSRPGFPI
ncbi:MAG: PDZ domain-containing protein [Pyrinomonadaceae bacterium]